MVLIAGQPAFTLRVIVVPEGRELVRQMGDYGSDEEAGPRRSNEGVRDVHDREDRLVGIRGDGFG